MAAERRPRALSLVVATVVTAVALLAVAPGAASSTLPGPLVDVRFVRTWTNDDGVPNPGDAGDTGAFSPVYDAWVSDPLSSSDPKDPGFASPREDKDVAVCIGRVSPGDPGIVEVVVLNAYPGYACTFTTVVFNGAGAPVMVSAAVIDADLGLAVGAESPQLPAVLAPGEEAPAVFSVGVLNNAPQNAVLQASIAITLILPPSGSLTIVKEGLALEDGDTTTFSFDGGGLGAFTLTGSGPGSSQTFAELEAGAYTVTEGALSGGWKFDRVECVASDWSASGTSVTVNLAEGKAALCTFYNHEEGVLPPTGSLTIVKVATPLQEPDDTTFSFDGGSLGGFTLTGSGPGSSQPFGNLEPGAYTVSEGTLSGGWQFDRVECIASAWSATGSSVTVNLAEGEAARCTFYNHEEGVLPPTGSLTIVKEARPADNTAFWFNGGSLGDFSLKDPADSSRAFTELDAGTYTVSELGLSGGWEFDEVECVASDWSATGSAVTVNLAEGEAALCTFRNAGELPYTGAPSWLVSTVLLGLAAFWLGVIMRFWGRRREAS